MCQASIDLSIRLTICAPMYFFGINVVKMVLHELNSCCEIRLVELVGYVPSDWSKLPPLLDGGVEEGNTVQHRFPLRQVADVELVL